MMNIMEINGYRVVIQYDPEDCRNVGSIYSRPLS